MAILHQASVALGKAVGALRYPSPATTPDHDASQALKQHCEQYPAMQTHGLTGAALAWADHNNTFRQHCIEQDPAGFVRWPVVRKTMYVDASPYLKLEYRALRRRADFDTRWRPVLEESWVGGPPRFWLDGRTSGNRVHMAYHVARFMEATGTDPGDFDAVLEFGGGYGCMCETIHRLGFKGRYLIYDLPIQSGLQRYFLSRHGRSLVEPDHPGSGITCLCEPDQIDTAISQLSGKRLLLATWSLSESPLEVRRPFESASQGFEGCMIGYQEQFEGVDNTTYFKQWVEQRPQQTFHHSTIDHLKRSHYLFGVPKS